MGEEIIVISTDLMSGQGVGDNLIIMIMIIIIMMMIMMMIMTCTIPP